MTLATVKKFISDGSLAKASKNACSWVFFISFFLWMATIEESNQPDSLNRFWGAVAMAMCVGWVLFYQAVFIAELDKKK